MEDGAEKDGRQVALFLMRMALVLLNAEGGLLLTAARLQHAIDGLEEERGRS